MSINELNSLSKTKVCCELITFISFLNFKLKLGIFSLENLSQKYILVRLVKFKPLFLLVRLDLHT